MLIAAATSLLTSGAARGQVTTEAHVKARVAFNLARFTQWPDGAFAEPAAPHLWCVAVHDGALAAALASLAGEAIGSRSIKLPRVASTSPAT